MVGVPNVIKSDAGAATMFGLGTHTTTHACTHVYMHQATTNNACMPVMQPICIVEPTN